MAAVYGIAATVFILIIPIITEFYEIRRFMIDRMAIEQAAAADIAHSPQPAAPQVVTVLSKEEVQGETAIVVQTDSATPDDNEELIKLGVEPVADTEPDSSLPAVENGGANPLSGRVGRRATQLQPLSPSPMRKAKSKACNRTLTDDNSLSDEQTRLESAASDASVPVDGREDKTDSTSQPSADVHE